jgi:hypothetical protein
LNHGSISLNLRNRSQSQYHTPLIIPSRSYASKPVKPAKQIKPAAPITSESHYQAPPAAETTEEQSRLEAYEAKVAAQEAAQGKGQRIGIQDKDGETHVLAQIPDDVRTYVWRTPDWSWGVLERLLQDCEQAKVTFELEEYVDEIDGKTRKRVKRDENGLHAGKGSGWWFEGKFPHFALMLLHMETNVHYRAWIAANIQHMGACVLFAHVDSQG